MSKQSCRTINWKEYNRALVKRGSLTVWMEGSGENWLSPATPKKRGRPFIYSDQAIICAMNLKAVYRLTYRALEGMVSSLMELGKLDLPVPSFQQIQKRASTLKLSKKISKKQPTDIVIDASGVKIYGEGEWQKERKKQGGKKKWKKIHVALDPKTGEVVMEEVTDSNCHDSVMLPDLIEGCAGRVKRVYADGAYDTRRCYQALYRRGIEAKIPPRMGAVTSGEEGLRTRDEAIRSIVALGGDQVAMGLWKKLIDYGRRSHVEGAFSRFKRAFGERLWSKKQETQRIEVRLKWMILNRFLQIGTPLSYAV